MRIGVVIPAYNAATWIGDALASVVAQTHRDWALVVVDDGSTDGTADIVADFVDRRVRLVRQANAGVSAARNTGLQVLCGGSPWGGCAAFLFLDADDRLAPDAMARLAAALDAAPDAVAAVGAYAVAGHRGVRRPRSGDLLRHLLVRNLFANGGHLLIRDRAVRGAGGFRTDLAYGEDWEFWIRLALQGPFAAIADKLPVLFVRQHAGGAYHRFADDPASFAPCMNAIFANPRLVAHFGPARLAAIRWRTDAENAWVIGRELIRHGRVHEGRTWLRRSFRVAPSVRRAALLAASLLRIGPFVPYPAAARVNRACNDPTSPCGRKMMNTTSKLP